MKIIPKLSPFCFAITILLSCSLIQSLAPKSITFLRYQYTAVSNGELWRILTANLCHTNWNHLGLNMAGLLLIDYIFQPLISSFNRALLLTFCIIVNVVLIHIFLELTWYVGLSGALHGYLVGCGLLILNQSKKFAIALLLSVSIKLFIEMNWDINKGTASLIEANVVEEAHLFGATAAVIFYGLLRLIQIIVNKKGP